MSRSSHSASKSRSADVKAADATGNTALRATARPASWRVSRFGARRVYLASLLAFTFASGLCALAPTIGVLIAARALHSKASRARPSCPWRWTCC